MDYDKIEIPTRYDKARVLAPETRRLWHDLLSVHIGRAAVSLIIDLGCGTGRFSEARDQALPAMRLLAAILRPSTTSWLAAQPIGRFTFTFTPTHGSWLNLIEGFFSKLVRSVLRYIRVSSKHELGERLMAFIADINREPVVHTWRYKIDNAA